MEFYVDGSLDRHFAVLGLLVTVVLGGSGGLGVLYSLFTGNFSRAKRLALGLGGIAVAYSVVLVAFALTSEERILDPGAEKYMCEVDCHLAYSIQSTDQLEPSAADSSMQRIVLTVRVRFDEQTTSSRRSTDLPLRPNGRLVLLQDDQGNQYHPVNSAELFESTGAGPPRLRTPLRPGETTLVNMLFELPGRVVPEKLLISSSDEMTRILIGHENSILHKKTYLAIPPPGPVRARS